MSEEIRRDKFPSGGGWKYRQPQFGNWENKMALVGFDASVTEIRNARIRNKALSIKHNLSTDPDRIAIELIEYNQKIRGISLPAPPSSFRQSSHLPARVVAAAASIKRAAQGTAVALDWIQAGGDPVEQSLAEKRAVVCAACPKNVPGAWYTEAPAELLKAAIKGWQSLKGSNFDFVTKQGDAVKSCDVCKCLMRLKVFCPLSHILERTPPEIMAEFPSHCWIVKRDA